jgi:multicomponent K+:H+ antiporter subunit D
VPPLSGFVVKVMLLQASFGGLPGAAIWAVLLGTTLLALLALTRAGITLFWSARRATVPRVGSRTALATGAIVALLALLAGLSALGGPIKAVTDAAAAQLSASRSYIDNVLRTPGRI